MGEEKAFAPQVLVLDRCGERTGRVSGQEARVLLERGEYRAASGSRKVIRAIVKIEAKPERPAPLRPPLQGVHG